MRKQFLLLMALCLAVGQLWAERIDVATAREVARTVASRGSTLRSAGELSLVYAAAPGQTGSALRSASAAGEADYFVFNVPGDGGFVIVAGDDRVRPVLGYSHAGSFDPDNLPENLRGMLAFYQEQITWAEDNAVEASPAISAEWSQYQSGTALRAAGEKVLPTANWDQHSPYNLQTPTVRGRHTLTGCVATATAIVMMYHKWPETAVTKGVSSFDPINDTDFEPESSAFDQKSYKITYAPYDWKSMETIDGPESAGAQAVSDLMWNIGANVGMSYGLTFSGANSPYALSKMIDVFGYSNNIRYKKKAYYYWAEWYDMLRAEIDANRPVLYDGRTIENAGHAFVCDGYADDDYFHINWGWGGSNNGFFTLTAFDPENPETNQSDPYCEDMGMSINVQKPQAGESTEPYCELGFTILTTGATELTAGNSFSVGFSYENIGNCAFIGEVCIGIATVDASGNYSFKELISEPLQNNTEDNPLGIGSYYSNQFRFSCSLESDLAENERILPVFKQEGTDDWRVMRGHLNTSLFIGDKGNVNVYLSTNDFDGRYMMASGLDNSVDHTDNTAELTYAGLYGLGEDAILSYQLKDYSSWQGKVKIYTGEEAIGGPDEGSEVTINDDGSFEIPISYDKVSGGYRMQYTHYLKVLSSQAGELPFEVRVYRQSDQETPVFEHVGGKFIFLGNTDISIDPNPIVGTVGEDITFSLKVDELDPLLKNREVSARFVIEGATSEQIKIYQEGYTSPTTGGLFSLYLEDTNEYTLKAEQPINNAKVTLLCVLLDAGYETETTLPSGLSASADVVITNAEVETYSVDVTDLSHLTAQNVPAVITEGETLSFMLVPESGYQLPSTITVTMGGVTLTQGEGYFYAGNTISIPNVTGDIVVTAVAEPIPATTYTISAGQMENLTTNLPISVQEGKNVTITITANDRYLVPEAVTVKSGDTELSKDYYTYTPSEDRKSATLTIERVPSDLQIYAIAVPEPKTFTITGTLTNLTADPDITEGVEVKEGESLTVTFAVSVANHRLPDQITIMSGDVSFKDFTYADGTLVINHVTSNLTVTASAIDNTKYQVVFDLGEGITNNSDAESQYAINSKPTFMLDLNAAEGYDYDGSITVTMGGKELIAGTDYAYVYENDSFALLVPLTGTLTITAKATRKTYPITINYLGNVTTDIPENATVAHGVQLVIKVTPDEGYELPNDPANISIAMGGSDYTGWIYDMGAGMITIPEVTGAISVELVAVAKEFTLMNKLTNLTATPESGEQITYGEPLEVTLAVTDATLYALPKTITVMMAGVELETTEYSYNATTGVVRIEKVTGDVWITAEARQNHTVSDGGENVTINGDEIVADGGTYSGTIVPASGYKLPETITVLIGGKVIYPGQYTYDKETGAIEIRDVTGPITIIATAVPEGRYEVVLTLSHLVSSPASFEPVAEGEPVELTLSAASGYELPSSIQVTMGGTALTVGTDYTYNATTGAFKLESITGTLVITADGKLIPTPDPDPDPTPGPDPTPTPTTYIVTLPIVEGATIEAIGSTSVKAGDSFSFTVTVKEGYVATNMVVKANGVTLTPNADGRYTIANVRSNVVVTVTGIEEDPATAIESVDASDLKVWAADGRLFIQTSRADKAYVVTFDGRLYKALDLPAGETVTPMPQGGDTRYESRIVS